MNSRFNLLLIWLMAISFATPADETTHSFPLQFGSAQLEMTFHTSENGSYTEIGWLWSSFDHNNDNDNDYSLCLHFSPLVAMLKPEPSKDRKLRIFHDGHNLVYELVDVHNNKVIYKWSIPLPENTIVVQLPEALSLRNGTSASITLFDALNYGILNRIYNIVFRISYPPLTTTDAQITLPANSLGNNQNSLMFSFSEVAYTYTFINDEVTVLQVTDITPALQVTGITPAPGFHLLNAGARVANLCSRHLLCITVIVILVIVIGSLSQNAPKS